VFIWNFAGMKATENTLKGYGFYNSRDIAGGKDAIPLNNQSTPVGWVNLPNHPHNGMLQMWLELGLVGLSLYVLLIVASLSWMLKYVQSTLQRAVMVAMLVTYLGVSLLAFNIWQEWWIATGLLGFMLMRLYVDGFIDYPPCTRGGKTLR
jgi:O-antigen ligase